MNSFRIATPTDTENGHDKIFSGQKALYIIGDNRIMDPFDLYLSDLFHINEAVYPAIGPLADQYLSGLCQGFKPCCHVNLVSDHCVIHMTFGTYIPHGHVAGVDPDPHLEFVAVTEPLLFQFNYL